MSRPPFDTLNLGERLGDDPAAVSENRARFLSLLSLDADSLFEQRQVHGSKVTEVHAQDRPDVISKREGDALIARRPGQAVAARTADCVPVLLAHPPTGHVAAVHAGWRGAVAGVVSKAVEALDSNPGEIVAAVGPHIRVGAFEVGEDVAAELEHAAPEVAVVDRARKKPHGDLASLVTFQLLAAGLVRDLIDDVGGCTHRDTAHFFSHRRDGPRTGRHLSAIVARGPSA